MKLMVGAGTEMSDPTGNWTALVTLEYAVCEKDRDVVHFLKTVKGPKVDREGNGSSTTIDVLSKPVLAGRKTDQRRGERNVTVLGTARCHNPRQCEKLTRRSMEGRASAVAIKALIREIWRRLWYEEGTSG